MFRSELESEPFRSPDPELLPEPCKIFPMVEFGATAGVGAGFSEAGAAGTFCMKPKSEPDSF